jgi:hypothetical protein
MKMMCTMSQKNEDIRKAAKRKSQQKSKCPHHQVAIILLSDFFGAGIPLRDSV